MKPYSLDLRERVVAALVEDELTQLEIADTYDVSLRTVETWARQRRETGKIEPKPYRCGPVHTLRAHSATIRQAMAAQPDVTLEELCAQVAAQTHVRTNVGMMCRNSNTCSYCEKKVPVRQSARNGAGPNPAHRTKRQNQANLTSPRHTPQIYR